MRLKRMTVLALSASALTAGLVGQANPGYATDPLIVSLSASAGAADSSGKTIVKLDASGTTGAVPTASYSFDFGDGSAPLVSQNPVATRSEKEGTYKVTVTVTDSLNRTASSAAQWLSVGDGYHPLSPTRLLDTRYGVGAPAAAVGSMHELSFQLPASVTANTDGPLSAVVLNVTVTQPSSYGNIKVYPHSGPRPVTSNLNFSAGLTVANLVTVPVLDGKVTLYVESPGSAHLIADLSGYYTVGTSGAGYAPVSATRIMDTRYGTGVAHRVPAGGIVSLPVPASVPAEATAVVLNATAVDTSSYGNLTVYPDVPGQAPPTASNLNFSAKGTVPNLVTVSISANRTIDFRVDSPGSADLIADFEGYYSPTATAKFIPWQPADRVFDTRDPGWGGPLPSEYYIPEPMAYLLDVPVSALTAMLYNVTVTQPAGHGFITVFDDSLDIVPNVSNLNYSEGQTVPNAVLASTTNGKQDFYNGGTAATHLIADFFGYFAKPLATDAPPASPNQAMLSMQAHK